MGEGEKVKTFTALSGAEKQARARLGQCLGRRTIPEDLGEEAT